MATTPPPLSIVSMMRRTCGDEINIQSKDDRQNMGEFQVGVAKAETSESGYMFLHGGALGSQRCPNPDGVGKI